MYLAISSLFILGFVGFDVGFDEIEFFQDGGDMVDPVKSVNLAHLEVVVGFKDRLLGRALEKPVTIHNALDVVIDLVLVLWSQADEGVCGDVEEDCVMWCLL